MWLKPQGYAQILSPDSGRAMLDGLRCEDIRSGNNEYDTMSCFHCNRIIHVKPKMNPEDMGGLCKVCMKMICPTCVGEKCVPFEKKIEEMEQKDYLRKQYSMIMNS